MSGNKSPFTDYGRDWMEAIAFSATATRPRFGLRARRQAAQIFPIADGAEASCSVVHGIGAVTAHRAEIVLRAECAVLPVDSRQERYGVSLSLPSVLGREGVKTSWEPEMTATETGAPEKSADALRQAWAKIA